jgi:hypothetical protein
MFELMDKLSKLIINDSDKINSDYDNYLKSNKTYQQCININCNINASFNYSYYKTLNVKRLLYCTNHKLINMINIRSKNCIIIDCNIRASFNLNTEKIGIYCKLHKLDNMIDVRSIKCFFKSCKIQPTYNFYNEKKALYCKKHKLDDMIDVISKKCIFDNCLIQPSFNYKNEKIPLYCKSHKLDNMVDIIDRMCISDGCITRPSFHYENEKVPIYCNNHRLDNMVDIRSKKCIICNINYSNRNYKKHCYRCFLLLFPNDKKIRNHKVKENQIIKDLEIIFPNIIQDKIIQGGTSKKRPDGLIKLQNYNIIIEIDEEQHNRNNYINDNERLLILFQDLQNKPLTMIRFNPDKYIDINKHIIPSLFSISKENGMLQITNKKKYNIRLEKLIDAIKESIVNIPVGNINEIKLYYDQYLN